LDNGLWTQGQPDIRASGCKLVSPAEFVAACAQCGPARHNNLEVGGGIGGDMVEQETTL
jgi:hypothetical protein